MKNIYKYILISLLILTGVGSANTGKAQVSADDIDKIRAQRVAFFTEKLNLTSTEAEKFWPIYNEYKNKVDKLFAEEKALIESFKESKSSLSDAEMDNMIKKIFETRRRQISLSEESFQKFRQVLPARKVLKLMMIENQFKSFLLNRAMRPGR
jgi:hypothetical protein